MYYINDFGQKAIAQKKASAIQILLVVIPLAFIMGFVLYLAMARWTVEFYFLALPFLMVNLTFQITVTLISLKRANRTICRINFEGDIVTFNSLPMFWLREREYCVKYSDIKARKTFFPWYGKNKNLEGFNITCENQSLFLVKNFFDNFEEIDLVFKC